MIVVNDKIISNSLAVIHIDLKNVYDNMYI